MLIALILAILSLVMIPENNCYLKRKSVDAARDERIQEHEIKKRFADQAVWVGGGRDRAHGLENRRRRLHCGHRRHDRRDDPGTDALFEVEEHVKLIGRE